jgi:aminodeoxyfutalosine deaminase
VASRRITRFHAAWVLPLTGPPIRDGWVTVRDGVVVDVGGGKPSAQTEAEVGAGDSARVEVIDLGRVAMMPGLVNAHTHLELSFLWGKVPPADSLVEWVSRMMPQRAALAPAAGDVSAITNAILDMEEAGTAAVGDIANTFDSIVPIAQSRLHAVVFRELIGFNAPDPAARVAAMRAEIAALPAPTQIPAQTPSTGSPRDSTQAVRRTPPLHVALAPHAPYSVSPDYFRAIAADSEATRGVSSVHLGESRDEVQFLASGEGPFRALLERVGAWNPSWTAPQCGPAEYLDRLGVLSPRLLAVHGVMLRDDELKLLAERGATLVTCPRSNVWVGSGNPPIDRFYASGVRVAVGTDSLASATDFNIFSELALMHHIAPHVAPSRLLASATVEGARALGFDRLGFIGADAQARLITVDLPDGIRDVETYLVEGIDPGQIAWVPANPADARASRADPR